MINDNNRLEITVAALLIIAAIAYWATIIQTAIETSGEAF